MATNSILPFGATASNELTLAAYTAEAQRLTGNQPGKASSKLNNKVLHQTSLIAAGVAQFMADRQGTDVVDTLTPAQIATMLAGVLAGQNLLTTPALFDSDTSPATTAFVQRALGNYQGAYPAISGPTPLVAADAGKTVIIGAGGSVSLPLGSTLAAGVMLLIGASANGRSISASGSDTINTLSTSITSFTLDAGDTALLVWNGATWVLFGGTGQLQFATKFAASLAGNGWQRLPSGLILQWGTANLPASGVNTSVIGVTFPIAFPTAVYSISAMPRSQISGSGNRCMTTAEVLTNSGFSIVGDTNNGALTFAVAVPTFWTAIGR